MTLPSTMVSTDIRAAGGLTEEEGDVVARTLLPSKAAVEARSFPTGIQQVRTAGTSMFADALPADWSRVDRDPGHPGSFRALDRFLSDGVTEDKDHGGWFVLATDKVSPEHVADPADTQAGLANAMLAAQALGKEIELLGRSYVASETLLQDLGTSGVVINGAGKDRTFIIQADRTWSKVLRFVGDSTYQQYYQAGIATGTKVVTGLADLSNLVAGMPVSGRYIPAGTTIQSVDGLGQITLTKAAKTTGIVGMVFKPLVDNRPSVTLRNLTVGQPFAAGYTGAIGPQTISIDYCKDILLENVGGFGSIGWCITAAFSENITIRGCDVWASKPKTGTDGINLYKCSKITIDNCTITGVGDDPISVGSYDPAWPCDDFNIHDCRFYNCTGSIKVYGGARNGIIHHCRGYGSVTGCVGLWNDRPSAQAIGMYNIRIDHCHAWDCGTTGALGAFNVYSSVPGGTANAADPLTYMEDITFDGCTANGGQYGLSIYSNADVLATKRARRITVRGCEFINQTNGGINALGIDDFLLIEGGFIRDTAGPAIFLKDSKDGLKLDIHTEIDGLLSNQALTVGLGAIFLSTMKNVRLDTRRTKVSNNRRASTVLPVRTEATTFRPESFLEVDADATFSAQTQPTGWRGSGAKVVSGGAARITTPGYTYQTGQTCFYPLAAPGASPGDDLREGGTCGTLYAADGLTPVTITTTAGSKAAVVSDPTNLFPGAWIAIPGLAGYFILTDVPGATVQLHRAPDAAVTGVAAGYYGPTITAKPAAAVTGGAVAFPMDGNNYLIDLDSLVGQGHEVLFQTTIPKLLASGSQGIKIRFSEVFLIDIVWKIIRVGAPNVSFRLSETINYLSYTGTLTGDGAVNVDYVAESAPTGSAPVVPGLKAQRTYSSQKAGTLPGTFTFTCPNYGTAHAPLELVYKPPAGSADFMVKLMIDAVKSGGN